MELKPVKREDAGTRDVQTEMKELGSVWANLWIATFVQHPLEGHQLTRRSNPRIVEDGAQSDIPAAVEDGSARRSLLDDQWIRWEVSIPWIR